MIANYDELPYFENAPVVETVLGLFFRPIQQLNSVWQGVFWRDRLQSEFPSFELRPPVSEVPERFDKASSLFEPAIRWQVADEFQAPRLWAKTTSENHILQVQRNAILTNWLRGTEASAYERFAARLQDFKTHYEQLVAFLEANSLHNGSLTPSSCAVTYINQISLGNNETWSEALQKTLCLCASPSSDSWLPAMEQGRLQFTFAFPPRGRLHVTTSSVVRRDTKEVVLQLELTGRCNFIKDRREWNDIHEALDTCHEWVVRGFTSITHPEMHIVWRRVK
jgi:uncharacterized protein (TIGR04255 family)